MPRECPTGTATIDEITPDGTVSTYVDLHESGLVGLAFDATGNLFVSCAPLSRVYEVAPDRSVSVFGNYAYEPYAMAFQPVPEPLSVFALGAGLAVLVRRRRR